MSSEELNHKGSLKFHISTPRLVKQQKKLYDRAKSQVKQTHLSTEIKYLSHIMGQIPHFVEYNQKGIIQTQKSQKAIQFQKISNWTLGKPISQGQSAIIYKAIHKDTGVIAAVKKIIYDEKDRQQHRKQLQILCKTNHKNVVKYMHHHQSQYQTWIFMEYVPTTLKNYIQAYGTLPVQNYMHFAKQIIGALDYLHRQKIVHKDIKCSNILLDNDAVVKISDFGCSKSFDQTLSLVNYQKQGCRTFKGSILWMAPQVFQQSIYNRKTDIWSLGCALLELATGKPPWYERKFDNELSAVWIIAKQGQLPQIPENVHPQIKKLILKCIIRNPDSRWSTSQLLLHLG